MLYPQSYYFVIMDISMVYPLVPSWNLWSVVNVTWLGTTLWSFFVMFYLMFSWWIWEWGLTSLPHPMLGFLFMLGYALLISSLSMSHGSCCMSL